MNRMVVHHIYSGGVACDLSGYRNHGVPYDVSEASPPYAPAFGYSSSDSRVIVPQSQSLQDLLAVRAVAELAWFRASRSLLERAPRGDGHPVLVLPGLMASDRSTAPMRAFLGRLGYQVEGFELGRNRPTAELIAALRARASR